MENSPSATSRVPGAPRKRSNSLPSLDAPHRPEEKNALSPFTLSAHKRKGGKEVNSGTKFKRINPDDDDDDESESGPDMTSQQNTDDTVDESFFDLLKTFASLDLPDENKIEQCPICSLTMPLAQFAEHVYECIKQLDPEETKEQVRLDAQLAQQLSSQLDETEFEPKEQGSPCPQGSACRRYDASHHRWFSHPLVACPICTEEFTVFAIDAHVGLCLEMAGSYQSGNFSGDSDTAMNSGGTGGAFQGDAFNALRGSRKGDKTNSKLRKKVVEDDDEEDDGEDEDEDGDDDEDEDLPPPLTTPAQPAPTITRTTSLSRSQMKAMAQAVIDQKSKPVSKQDVSLVAMLETFRGLGFTKESLSHEINKDKQLASSSATSFSLPPASSPPPVVFHPQAFPAFDGSALSTFAPGVASSSASSSSSAFLSTATAAAITNNDPPPAYTPSQFTPSSLAVPPPVVATPTDFSTMAFSSSTSMS